MNWPPKDPNDSLDYSLDWSAWLGTDTITTSTWTVPAGLTVGVNSHSDTVTTLWLSGGTAGTYKIINRIVTAAGRTTERTVTLRVVER